MTQASPEVDEGQKTPPRGPGTHTDSGKRGRYAHRQHRGKIENTPPDARKDLEPNKDGRGWTPE